MPWIEPPAEPSHRPPDPDPLASSVPRQPAAHSRDSRPQPTAPDRDLPSLEEAEAYIRAHMTTVSPNMRTYAVAYSPRAMQQMAETATQRRQAQLADELMNAWLLVLNQDFAHIRPEGSPLPQLLASWQLKLLADLVKLEPAIRSGDLRRHFEQGTSEAGIREEIDRLSTLWRYMISASKQLHCEMCGASGPFSLRPPQADGYGILPAGLRDSLGQCAGCGRLICYTCLKDGRCDKCRPRGRSGWDRPWRH